MGLHDEARLDQKFIGLARQMNLYLRFIRKHALYVFRQSIKSGQVESLVSSLGHALRTHSLRHMLCTLKEKYHALYRQLPQVFRRVHLA